MLPGFFIADIQYLKERLYIHGIALLKYCLGGAFYRIIKDID